MIINKRFRKKRVNLNGISSERKTFMTEFRIRKMPEDRKMNEEAKGI